MLKRSIKSACFMFSLLLFGFLPVNADIINVTDFTESGIQNALDQANYGDIVVLPEGVCQLGSELIFSEKITLKGKGTDKTVLTNISGSVLFINLRDSGSRITNMKLVDLSLNIDVCDDFRIDNCFFYSDVAGMVKINISNNMGVTYRQASGVIDSNVFNNGRIIVFGGTISNSNTQWTLPLSLGAYSNVVFIEDNEFIRTAAGMGNCIDANYGGAYVFRYNTVRIGTGGGSYNLMTHSIQGNHRATRFWEIYGNIIDDTYTNANADPLFIRAGTGFIFYNKITNYPSWHSAIFFDNKRDFNTYSESGTADGSSCWDGNEEPNGYPARDQIGRGPDAVLWDQAGCGPYTQPLVPAGVFVNRNQNNSEILVEVLTASQVHIKPNRDFYEYDPGFTGASGVGTGTLSARPGSATEGVMYWATNQDLSNIDDYVGKNSLTQISGTLYQYTAGGWEEIYTPYDYPHPLRGSSQGEEDSEEDSEEDTEIVPEPPKNLGLN